MLLDLIPHIRGVLEAMIQSMLKSGWSKERIVTYLADHLNSDTYQEVIKKVAEELSEFGG